MHPFTSNSMILHVSLLFCFLRPAWSLGSVYLYTAENCPTTAGYTCDNIAADSCCYKSGTPMVWASTNAKQAISVPIVEAFADQVPSKCGQQISRSEGCISPNVDSITGAKWQIDQDMASEQAEASKKEKKDVAGDDAAPKQVNYHFFIIDDVEHLIEDGTDLARQYESLATFEDKRDFMQKNATLTRPSHLLDPNLASKRAPKNKRT